VQVFQTLLMLQEALQAFPEASKRSHGIDLSK